MVLQSFLSAAEVGELVESVARQDAWGRTAVVGGQTVCAAELVRTAVRDVSGHLDAVESFWGRSYGSDNSI